jgi:sugar phosphate permease
VTFPVFVFGLWLLYSWLPEYLREKFSLGIADAAFTATAYMQTATLVGLLLGGVLADRLFAWTRAARIWLLVASFLGCAPCLHLIGACQSLPAMTASLIGFGLASGFLMGNIFPAAFEVVPASTRASAVGVLNLFAAVISGFAPLLGGMWRRTIGLERLMDYTSIAYLAGALLLVVAIIRFFPRDYARAQDTLPGTDA